MALTEAERFALIARIERGSTAAWPALETVRDWSWLWRFANGYTKRANCIQAMALSDDGDARARIEAHAERSRAYGIRPVFRVTALTGPGIIAVLDEMDWASFDNSLVFARPLEGIGNELEVRHRVVAVTSKDWLAVQQALQGYDEKRVATLLAIGQKMPKQAAGIVVDDASGHPTAALMVSVADGIAHFLNVITDKGKRRQGLGRMAMALGLAEAKRLGAEMAALAVLQDNVAARGLYLGAGFTELGSYYYRAPAQ